MGVEKKATDAIKQRSEWEVAVVSQWFTDHMEHQPYFQGCSNDSSQVHWLTARLSRRRSWEMQEMESLLVGYVSAIMMQKYDGFKLWDGQESSKQRTDSLGWWFACFVLTVFAPQDGEIRTEDIGHLQSRLIVCFGSKFTANCRWIRNAV